MTVERGNVGEQPPLATFVAKLQAELAPLLERFARLPFFAALSANTLPPVAYVNQLRAFAPLFKTLERLASYLATTPQKSRAPGGLPVAMVAILESAIRTERTAEKSHFQHIMADLTYFNGSLIPEITNVRQRVDALGGRMRFLAHEDPNSLIGYIITLHGLLGVIGGYRCEVQNNFQVGLLNGTAFYRACGDTTPECRGIYENLVNSCALEGQVVLGIRSAMEESYTFLEEIHGALYPLPGGDGMRFSAASINPEVASHGVPTDAREVGAAIVAGKRCLKEFAYFEARYGERVTRFASGDSAWLVTLAQLDHQALIRKVQWFGGYLAALGLPRITLERQLVYLHEELGNAFPDKPGHYDRLLEAVDWLRSERLKHISTGNFHSLCHAFAAMTDDELAGEMKGTGLLIVSAVCDEKAAVKVEKPRSIEAWLTNTDNFSDLWVSAVRELFVQARSTAVF